GRPGPVVLSAISDLALSSLIAPILMAFQTRSVLQVLRGADGGWPANRRGEARLTVTEAFEACHFMVTVGLLGLFASWFWIPALLPWLLPVLGPMILSPLLIAWTSRPSAGSAVFGMPEERALPPILARHDAILARWGQSSGAAAGADTQPDQGTADA
ncbi:MAG: hypothetical protein KDG55_23810, partial [Rhodocyclaceae bacterium]|nr:hypothetical protein [Rhodocyclaceae bacterium]